MSAPELTEDIRQWDAIAREWVTVRVPATPAPKPASRRRARPARDRLPLESPVAPISAWWRDTAFADQGPLADLRTYVKPAAMRTHRAPAVLPVPDMGHVIDNHK